MAIARLDREVDPRLPRAAFDDERWVRSPGFTCLVIAGLMVSASLGGLFLPDLYRDNTWSQAAFRGTDLATLMFAVPVLLVALAWARRGAESAGPVLLGALAYNIYNYAFYLFGAAFNEFFLLYAALIVLSAVALFRIAPRVLAVRPSTPPRRGRIVGGYMALVGVMFMAMWVAQSIRFIATGEVPQTITDSGIHTSVVFALDLMLVIPLFLTAAVLLWREHPIGFLLGVVGNVVGALYMLALAVGGGFQQAAGVPGASWAATPYLELFVTSLAACLVLLRRPRPIPSIEDERGPRS